MSDPDFLSSLETIRAEARAELVRLVDRCEALTELWNRAVALQAERRWPVDLSDLRLAAKGELEAAELEATIERAKETRP